MLHTFGNQIPPRKKRILDTKVGLRAIWGPKYGNAGVGKSYINFKKKFGTPSRGSAPQGAGTGKKNRAGLKYFGKRPFSRTKSYPLKKIVWPSAGGKAGPREGGLEMEASWQPPPIGGVPADKLSTALASGWKKKLRKRWLNRHLSWSPPGGQKKNSFGDRVFLSHFYLLFKKPTLWPLLGAIRP